MNTKHSKSPSLVLYSPKMAAITTMTFGILGTQT